MRNTAKHGSSEWNFVQFYPTFLQTLKLRNIDERRDLHESLSTKTISNVHVHIKGVKFCSKKYDLNSRNFKLRKLCWTFENIYKKITRVVRKYPISGNYWTI